MKSFITIILLLFCTTLIGQSTFNEAIELGDKALRSGQFDDGYTPSVRMLFEDELVKDQTKSTNKEPKKTN